MDIMTNNLQVVQDYRQIAPKAFPGKGKSPAELSEADFAAEIAQAGMLAAQVQPQLAVSQPEVKPGAGEAALLSAKAATMDAGKMALRASSAELSELTQKPAASMNTADAIAGLKPWNKDWVFTGFEEKNPELQSLFGATRGDAELAKLAGGPGAQQSGAVDQVPGGNAQAPGDLVPLEELNSRLQTAGEVIEGPAQQGARKPIQNSLSGAEFLTTLSAVRAPAAGKSQSQQHGSGNSGESGLGSKPSLKVIEGGAKSRKSEFGAEALGPALLGERPLSQGAPLSTAAPSMEVTGRVVKGAMSQDRLDSVSLSGLSAGIRNLTPSGGGEIRVRLNPENLGELHIRVATRGNQVGLQIQASDENARKILEESMSHLKESLASQSLTLGKVDLSIAASGNTAQGDMRQDNGQAGQNAFAQADLSGQNAGQSNQGRSDRWDNVSDDFVPRQNSLKAPAAASVAGGKAGSSLSASGRLDVRA